MTLLQAPALGIDRFANDRPRENRAHASVDERNTLIRAVYQQVLGQQHLMASERLAGAESLFRHGDLTVRELVRTVAKSGLYRKRFFESSNPYRFIELNHKHLLGRAPHNREEMLHHFTILQEQGYDAEIDSYLDSHEYQERFGQDGVPYIHGWDYSVGHEGRQFSWLMQLARGASASVKGSRSGHQSVLNRSLHQNRPVPVPGAQPAVIIRTVAPQTDYSRISTEGPFRAVVASGSALEDGEVTAAARRAPNPELRSEALGIGAGGRGTAGASGRLVTISATGIANNAYSRAGATVIRVPYSRMNEALQRIHRLGGRVTAVAVTGEDTIVAGPAPKAAKKAKGNH